MSGQESDSVEPAASNKTIPAPEIVELAAVNGATTKPEIVGQSASKRNIPEPEIVELAPENGANKEPEIALKQSTSTGRSTTKKKTEEQAASNGTTKESWTGSTSLHGFLLKVEISRPRPSQGPESAIEWLDLSRSVIDEKEKKLLARKLENGELPNLKVLFLEGNAADVGVRAMLNALRDGLVQKLEKLILWEVSSYQQITTAEEGTDTITQALADGHLPKLKTLDLTGSLPKLIPARTKLQTIEELLFGCSLGKGRLLEGREICLGCLFFWTTNPEKNQALECLRCLNRRLQVYSGDAGIKKIATALNKTPISSLKILILQDNYIGDEGASKLAEYVLQKNKLPNLEELDLQKNPVGYKGARSIVLAYLRNPLLTVRVKLNWPDSLLREHAVSFRESNIRLEDRLEKWENMRTSLVTDEYTELKFRLSVGPEFRLHLNCQAEFAAYGSDVNFKSHEVADTEGIEVTRRPLIGNSAQRIVQRALQRDPLDRKDFDMPSPNDEGRAINRIYIRSSTRYFARAANSKAVQTVLCHKWPRLPKPRKETIEELLMLAESRPAEFYAIFGLRQVLLQNRSGKNKGLYSRVWVCKSCFEEYKKLEVVHPITTDAELKPRFTSAVKQESSPAQSPKPKNQLPPHWLQSLLKSSLNKMKALKIGWGASHTTDA